MPESRCNELEDTLEEVNLKLSLWQCTAEFSELSTSWCSSQFEALDVPAMEEAVARWVRGNTLCGLG